MSRTDTEQPATDPPPGPADAPPDEAAATTPSRPGAATFTIEGRAAPGLFVLGWLATLMGLGILVVGVLAAGGAAIALILGGLMLLVVGLVAGAGAQALERRSRGAGGYAGPSPILVLAAVIPLALLLHVVAGVPMAALGIDPESPFGFFIGLLLIGATYWIVLRLVVVGTDSLSWRDMGIRRPGGQQLTELVMGGLMGFPLLVITGLLAAVLATFLPTPGGTLPLTGGPPGLLLDLVTAAVVTPIAEETFFRGFATTAWSRAVGANGAIVRGALLFAAAHILTVSADTFGQGVGIALFAFVARVPVALALGWVFVRSRSLYASIGLHAVFNAVPILAYLLVGRA